MEGEQASGPASSASATAVAVPPGMRGERKAKPRREGQVSQCLYLPKEFHARAVAFAKANKEAGREPDTFSGLVVQAVEEYLTRNGRPILVLDDQTPPYDPTASNPAPPSTDF